MHLNNVVSCCFRFLPFSSLSPLLQPSTLTWRFPRIARTCGLPRWNTSACSTRLLPATVSLLPCPFTTSVFKRPLRSMRLRWSTSACITRLFSATASNSEEAYDSLRKRPFVNQYRVCVIIRLLCANKSLQFSRKDNFLYFLGILPTTIITIT